MHNLASASLSINATDPHSGKCIAESCAPVQQTDISNTTHNVSNFFSQMFNNYTVHLTSSHLEFMKYLIFDSPHSLQQFHCLSAVDPTHHPNTALLLLQVLHPWQTVQQTIHLLKNILKLFIACDTPVFKFLLSPLTLCKSMGALSAPAAQNNTVPEIFQDLSHTFH
jgi:hypothetical protein